ncbi:urease accessory protein F isoform X2 [Asparagus officinalis]|nr:urease accessory protein F isoform X2 [Asparagus officinalis]
MEIEMEQETNHETLSSSNNLLQWSQWQLLDSLLPTGGFAHSYGLEAAIQSHLVSDHDDLKSYIIQILDNTGSLLLPFVYTATKYPTVETWSKLDKRLEATLTNEISRKASTSQGSALLRVSASVFLEIPTLKEIRDTYLGSGTVSFHHGPIFGLICGLLGFDCSTAQRAYMFMTMRDVVSAATRLNLVGPIGGSVLQHEIAAGVGEELVKKWMDRDVEDACLTSPLIDTVQGCHGQIFFSHFVLALVLGLVVLARSSDGYNT